MIKSRFARTLTLGICFITLSSSMVFANGWGNQPLLLTDQLSQLPVPMIEVSEYTPDTPVPDSAQQPININDEILQKQSEIDKYLFEDHVEAINKKSFKVTHTGPFNDYVEIGITPYNEENTRYLYEIFGEDMVKVVEGQQAVILPSNALEADIIYANASDSFSQYENKIIKKDKDVKIQVNGQWLQLDVKPFIENDRTLMPLRGVTEKLGTKVEWHPEQDTVVVHTEDINIELVIGEDTAKIIRNINGTLKEETLKLEVAAKIVENRTFIPGRFVTETLGAKVQWDASLRAMIIETDNMTDIISIENLVEGFGKKLQLVSLLAPEDIVNKSMQENYSEFISATLLEKWQNDPQNAPGRLTSSPWPDRIEILTTEKVSEHEYEVKGEIIEITSTEEINGGVAAKQPITLLVKKDDNRWFIDDVTVGIFEETDSVVK